MKATLNNSAINDLKWMGDLIGVLLVLLLGIGGQIFMLNPIRILTPKLPMLSQQDWSRSQVIPGLEISRHSPNVQEFLIRMEIKDKAYIQQKTAWYAKSTQAASESSHRLNLDFRNVQPTTKSSLSENEPASMLFCRNVHPWYACTYLAYTEHWYTEVDMWSLDDAYLSSSEMQQIVKRVDELLIAAPEKP